MVNHELSPKEARLREEILGMNNSDTLGIFPIGQIETFLGGFNIKSPRSRLFFLDSVDRTLVRKMLLEAGINIGSEALHADGAYLQELDLIVIPYSQRMLELNIRADISEGVYYMRKCKTIIHESMHGDGDSLEGHVRGYVKYQPESNIAQGYFLEEGVAEYIARRYLAAYAPEEWLTHMNTVVSTPTWSSRYINFPGGLINFLKDQVSLSGKNNFGTLYFEALYLTPSRLNDPDLTESSVAAIGIDRLINNFGIPVNLLVTARKDVAAREELIKRMEFIQPGLLDRLMEAQKTSDAFAVKANFWDTTFYLQKLED